MRRINRSTLILAAATLDWLLGDPEQLPHPVRLIGTAITRAEALLHPRSGCLILSGPIGKGGVSSEARPLSSNAQEFLAGVILTTTITALAYLIPAMVQRLTRNPILEILLASTTLAARNLDDEARPILRALEQHDLPQARLRLARIVGRDTQQLDQPAICRALIETLAESLSDGIVAPLFYLAIGGVPAAMAFKAVSTMDSMIGHRTPRHLYFGRSAARLDDAANFIPARLTALAILACEPAAAPIYRRDRNRHASPNAGHPESAMAGALGVQLGGPSTYAGNPHLAPLLNAGARLPTTDDARRALRITRAIAIATTFLAAGLAFLAERSDR